MRVIYKFELVIFLFSIMVVTLAGIFKEDQIVAINIDKTTLSENIAIKDFSVEKIKLITTTKSGVIKKIPLNEEMLSLEAKSKLKTIGKHNVEVNYKNNSTSFSITLIDNALSIMLSSIHSRLVNSNFTLLSYEEWIAYYNNSNNKVVKIYFDENSELIFKLDNGELINVGVIFKVDNSIFDSLNEYVNISLNLNGGRLMDDAITNLRVKKGTSYEFPLPIKENHDFKGWYYNNELITEDSIIFTDMTLEARFDLKMHQVKYINPYNGHILHIQYVEHGSSLTYFELNEENYHIYKGKYDFNYVNSDINLYVFDLDINQSLIIKILIGLGLIN